MLLLVVVVVAAHAPRGRHGRLSVLVSVVGDHERSQPGERTSECVSE